MRRRNSHSDVPTNDELVSAYRYIRAEFNRPDGQYSGEDWAEGLAFGYPVPTRSSLRSRHADVWELDWERDLADIKEIRTQLPESLWRQIGERATYLARDQYMSTWGVRGGRST